MPVPDRNSFVLGPVPTTINELRKQVDKNVVDVTEVQTQVAEIEPVAQTISVTAGSGGIFIGTVSTFNDATQVAQVSVGGTTISMDNYSGRALLPGNLVACSYLTDQPTVAVIVGVFRGEGYEPPIYTTPVVPASFPVFGEGLSSPIIGNPIDPTLTTPLNALNYSAGGQYWFQDFADTLGRGVDTIVALGRFQLPSPYPPTTAANDVIIYNQNTSTLSFLSGPSAGSFANGPIVVPNGIIVTAGTGARSGKLYFYNVTTNSWSQLSLNDVAYPLIRSGGYTWVYEENTSGRDWLTAVSIDVDGLPVLNRKSVSIDVLIDNTTHITDGGNIIWLTDGGDIQYTSNEPTDPVVVRYQDSEWGGGGLFNRWYSGADGSGNLQGFVFNGLDNYNIIKVYSNYAAFTADVYENVFDPAALPIMIFQVVPAGTDSVYVAGNVLAEHVDPEYEGTGLLMPAIWEVSTANPSASSSRIWTGTDLAAPHATVTGIERRAAEKLRWMSTISDGVTKQTYLFDSDL